MSDTEKKPAGTTGFIAKVVAFFTGAAAALAALPQDAILKEGVPGLWESFKDIVALNWLRLVEIYERLNPKVLAMARKLWRWAMLLTLASAGLIAFGVQLKEGQGSDLGHVMAAIGVLLGSLTLLAVWWFADVFVAILAFKLDMAKKIATAAGSTTANLASKVGVKFPEATASSGISLADLQEKVKRSFAAIPVIAFSLMFIMLFPSWSTIGWVVCMWVPVLIIATSAIYLGKPFGMAIEAVLKIAVGVLVFLAVTFLAGKLFPKSFGSIGFGGLDGWLSARNRSEWILMILAVIPLALLIVSVFAKDPMRKIAFRITAKYVGIAGAVLALFLFYRGDLDWKQSTKQDPPATIIKAADKLGGAIDKALDGSPKYGPAPVPQGAKAQGATYMAPPSGNVSVPDPAPSARTSPPRAKKPPLPPLKATKYDDAATAVTDLESLL